MDVYKAKSSIVAGFFELALRAAILDNCKASGEQGNDVIWENKKLDNASFRVTIGLRQLSVCVIEKLAYEELCDAKIDEAEILAALASEEELTRGMLIPCFQQAIVKSNLPTYQIEGLATKFEDMGKHTLAQIATVFERREEYDITPIVAELQHLD